ncbi:DUF3185 family protein [Thioalkalivibrio halophilus]|uniref:DUF3185 domain-containing protein n=1 Tax=Thioalkalivibrio halophilus TaxID=252474 RepID=A0A1V2ZZ00_9GAMM|nr:DUF3185 family protein [Thioalkalivibrio halophilus]OOC10332.1 DUF3185 domain-containing protein [Thioalkalivibrio halophilus]
MEYAALLDIFGIILLVAGAITALVGVQDAFTRRESARPVVGRFTARTLGLTGGGAVTAAIGLGVLLV